MSDVIDAAARAVVNTALGELRLDLSNPEEVACAVIEVLRPYIVKLLAEHIRPGSVSDPDAVAGRFVDRVFGEKA